MSEKSEMQVANEAAKSAKDVLEREISAALQKFERFTFMRVEPIDVIEGREFETVDGRLRTLSKTTARVEVRL